VLFSSPLIEWSLILQQQFRMNSWCRGQVKQVNHISSELSGPLFYNPSAPWTASGTSCLLWIPARRGSLLTQVWSETHSVSAAQVARPKPCFSFQFLLFGHVSSKGEGRESADLWINFMLAVVGFSNRGH